MAQNLNTLPAESVVMSEEDYELHVQKHVGHEHILGQAAVHTDLNTLQDVTETVADLTNPHIINPENEDVPDPIYKVFADYAYDTAVSRREEDRAHEIIKVREEIDEKFKLHDGAAVFDRHMLLLEGNGHVPNVFQNWLDESGAESWSDWLQNYATDDRLLNYLQWHNHRMAELQRDPRVQEKIAKQEAQYATALVQAVNDGILPDYMAEAALEKLENCDVLIGDVFDTLMRKWAGYHRKNTHYVVIEQRQLEHAAFHEFNHELFKGFPYTWLDEAMTEHVAQSLRKGRFELIDANGSKNGAYKEERELLQTLTLLVATEGEMYNDSEDILLELIEGYAGDDLSYKDFDEELTRVCRKFGAFEGSALAIIDIEIKKRYKAMIDKKMEPRTAMRRAVNTVRSDLLLQPHVLFGVKELVSA